MKMLSVLLLANCLTASATGFAQKVSLSLKEAPLQTAFGEITRQTGILFLYTEQQLSDARPVTIQLNSVSLAKAIDVCLKNQALEWAMINKTIVLTRKATPEAAKTEDSLRTVHGVVVSDKNYLPGVSIIIKGTHKGSITDSNGAFTLRVLPDENKLIVTSVGYEAQEVNIMGQSFVSIALIAVAGKLDEAVIIGYGSTTQRLNTGSVSKLSSKEIGTQPVSNPLAAMSGHLSGIFINQETGIPGGSFSIQIRGINSLRSDGNYPLYIVDGVPFAPTTLSSSYISGSITKGGNSLSALNSDDIESIDVLKDADATSIYGSRGANGVVLITTKKGKKQGTSVTVDFSAGWGKISRYMDLLDSRSYLQMRREAFANDLATPGATDYDINGTWDTTRNTDWQKELLGNTAHLTNAQVAVSTGNEYTQFTMNVAHRRETTVFPGKAANEKTTAHVHVNHANENNKFQLSLSIIAGKEENQLPQADLYSTAVTLAPVAPALYTKDGQLNWENSSWDNPLAYLLRAFHSTTSNLIANGVLSYELAPGLVAKASLGYTEIHLDELSTNPAYSFRPAYGVSTSSAIFGKGDQSSWIVEPQLTYQRQIGPGKLQLLGGATLQQDQKKMTSIFGAGYANTALLEDLQAAPSVYVISETQSIYKYAGLYARLNYNLKGTYLLNVTARRDGSSRFAPEKRYGNFGAAGAAWIFSNYDWIRQTLPSLSFGKLRGSYGTTGNDQIGDYQYLSTYSPTQYNFGGISGLVPTSLYNPDYSWEKNTKSELALELGLFSDKLLFSISHYSNTSSNQLVGYSLPPTTGFSSIQSNFPAKVRNSGWELELNTVNLKNDQFSWTSAFNISVPRNRLIAFPNIQQSSYRASYEIGKPLDIIKVLHATGINTVTGIYEFKDVNGNGSGTDYPEDIAALVNLGPQLFGGFQNSIHYRHLQLDLFVQYVKQNGYNYLKVYFTPPGSLSNQPVKVMDRWTATHTNASIQKFTTGADGVAASAYNYGQRYSDLATADASFIRLKNISLSYALPSPWLNKNKIAGCKLYLQAENLLTVTHYNGSDPENNGLGRLPPLKMVTAGIQLTL